MLKKLTLAVLTSSLIVTSFSAAFGQEDIICPAIVPQSAALSSEGTLGISFSSTTAGDSVDFSQYTPINQNDACFGTYAFDSIANSCLKFLNGIEDPTVVIENPESISSGKSCSAQDAEIQKLAKENRRLKNRIKRLTR